MGAGVGTEGVGGGVGFAGFGVGGGVGVAGRGLPAPLVAPHFLPLFGAAAKRQHLFPFDAVSVWKVQDPHPVVFNRHVWQQLSADGDGLIS